MALSANSATASLPTNYQYYTGDGINSGLNANQSFFTLNDKLVRIYSGAMHYFRVPRAYWRDRLKKIRAAGLNTVESYVPWNLHEPIHSEFDFGRENSQFGDFLHLEEFLTTAKEEDLFVILRPGPYICSEYNYGGFPSWLLREETMGFRTSEPTYMNFVKLYYQFLLPILAAFQFTQGGPIIAFQIENEYGNQEYGDVFQPDKEYLQQLRQIYLDNGIVELLVTSDSPLSHQDKGTLPGLFLQTANLGASVNEQLDKLEELQPGRPHMIMEYWVGWFDFWGTNHTGKSLDDTRKYLELILARNASFNAYMFIGGTNFAWNSGAALGNHLLDNSGFEAITTSYDYDSPLTENGAYTDKYYLFRELVSVAGAAETQLPDPPEPTVSVAYDPIKISKFIPYDSIVLGSSISSKYLQPMELLDINNGSGQSHGYIVYRKKNVDLNEESVLTIEGNVCDHVMVLINGELIAPKQLKSLSDLNKFGYYKLKNSSVVLNKEARTGVTLDLVVEEMGRMRGGNILQYNQSFKGLWQGNVTINDEVLLDWNILPLDLTKSWLESWNSSKYWQSFTSGLEGPTLYSAVLNITGEPEDTYVDISGWGKGIVFVNNFPLGRYADLGPQTSLYLPAPFLNSGENSIYFLEHFYVPEDGLVKFVDSLQYKTVY